MKPKMISKYRLICVFIASGLALCYGTLAGCANHHQNVSETMPSAELKQDEIAHFNEQLLASARVNTDPSDYLLGSGDLLQVKVFEAEDLNTTVRVSSRGYVTLPLLGAVSVKDLSAREAEEKIENLYRARYIKDPHVSIFVEEHFSRRITLMGQFRNPGTYDYLAKQRLLDVMALGGEARMNQPGNPAGNWAWRFISQMLDSATGSRLQHYTRLYQRAPDQQEREYGDQAL